MTPLLRWLFKSSPVRTFAHLDAKGHCQAFKQCAQPPAAPGWVEVTEMRLGWLGHSLPANARVSQPARECRRAHALSA